MKKNYQIASYLNTGVQTHYRLHIYKTSEVLSIFLEIIYLIPLIRSRYKSNIISRKWLSQDNVFNLYYIVVIWASRNSIITCPGCQSYWFTNIIQFLTTICQNFL